MEGAMRLGKSKHLGACAALLLLAAASATAKAEDRCIRFAVPERGGESSSIDPTVAVNQGDFFNVGALYEPIVWIDNNLEAKPLLAESWEANPEATVWTFHLKKGVKFHDGTEMTAKDVVWTYQRVLHPETGVAAKELSFVKPEDVVAVDDYTVKFSIASPLAEFPLLIGNKFAYISKAGVGAEELAKRSYGTGAFMAENFNPSDPVAHFVAFKDYWEAGYPKAPCIDLTSIPETVARAAAISTGEVDVATNMDPSVFSMLEANPDVKLVPAARGTLLVLAMFVDTKPFDDPRVRQALKLVVDRQAILDTVLLGYGFLANDNPIALTSQDAYRSDAIPRDVEKAKALLAEAGYPNGITVDLYTASIAAGTVNLAQAYQQMAADAGITVNVNVAPAETYWDDVWLTRPFVVSAWGARPTGSALAIAYRSDAKYNETHWKNLEFDALLDKANSTLDPEERRKLYQAANKLIAEDGGVVAPVFATLIAAVRSNCDGFTPHSDWNRTDVKSLHCK
jgi:peptide/nickel transport system substrate-binding protein